MTAAKTFTEIIAELEAAHGKMIGNVDDLSVFFACEYGWLISPSRLVTRRIRGKGCPSVRLRGRILHFEGPARAYAKDAAAAHAAPKRWQERLAERLAQTVQTEVA